MGRGFDGCRTSPYNGVGISSKKRVLPAHEEKPEALTRARRFMEEQVRPTSAAVQERQTSPIPRPFPDAKSLALAVAQTAWSKNAYGTRILDVSKVANFTDFFVILSGRSDRHVQAISEAIEAGMKEQGVRPLGVEGRRAGTWILMDYGDVVVHVFEQRTREFYDLERLWSDAEDVQVTEPPWVQDFARMEAQGD